MAQIRLESAHPVQRGGLSVESRSGPGIAVGLLFVVLGMQTDGQEKSIPKSPTIKPPLIKTSKFAVRPDNSDLDSSKPAQMRFSFEGTPWREVINWIAKEADLALHVGDLPTGSFTYSDPNSFTHDDAIDRVNLFLLPQGFTLVRSGNLLSVINLGDPRSMRQLDALAKLVQVEQLEQMQTHDVVKCIFPLGEFKAADAVEELSALKLMTTPTVFSKTNQLMITDTVANLRTVKSILGKFKSSTLTNGTTIKSFPLKHVDAEDLLQVMRPHLGLATGEMIGIDVSLSADVQGKNIFVSGVEDKVKLIETLITSMDQPKKSLSPDGGQTVLRSHIVEGGNVETVYNVLLTLLAGKSVRLSMDKTAGSVVALATPEVQSDIAKTVAELQASEADFEIIPLKTIDPYFAISLLEQMMDVPDPFDEVDEDAPPAPKIDADPGNMRLFVRAKKHQIDQIKQIIAKLDGNDSVRGGNGSDLELRLLPLRGKRAEELLVTAARFWRDPNPIIMFRSTSPATSGATERVVGEAKPTSSSGQGTTGSRGPAARLLSENNRSQAPAIRCQVTPRGLMLQSDDTKALDKLEKHLRTIGGPIDSAMSSPIVFYLKYTKPEDAIRMLAELLDGGETAKEGEAGSLVNGFVTTGSFLGSLVTTREGTTTMTSGSTTVVADSRLNRLIAQGSAGDMERIESYLKIVDKDRSITSIETYGTSQVIELTHSKASAVAAVLREAYAGRIAGLSPNGGPGPGGGSTAPRAAPGAGSPTKRAVAQQEDEREESEFKAGNARRPAGEKRPAANKAAGGRVKDLEPKMTIAVHEPSNSLIVTAPEQLFQEVQRVVKLIDSRNEQTVEFIAPANSAAVRSALQRMLSIEVSEGSGGSTAPRTSPPSTSPGASPRPSRAAAPRVFRNNKPGQ